MTEQERLSELAKLRLKIDEKLADAKRLIHECEQISDRSGLGFRWNLAYGMGGYYYPDNTVLDPQLKDPEENEDDEYAPVPGWSSSSSDC